MKPTAFLLFCFITIGAQAQQKNSSVSQSAQDDGKTLTLKINAVRDDKVIEYNQQFDVRGKSKSQKDAFVRHITDSLGVTRRKIVKL